MPPDNYIFIKELTSGVFLEFVKAYLQYMNRISFGENIHKGCKIFNHDI